MQSYNPIKPVEVLITKTISDVFRIYNQKRPNGLESSFIIGNHEEDNNAPSFGKQMLENVGEGIAVAEAGAILGQNGVIAVTAYRALTTIKNNIWSYFENDKDQTMIFYDLNYVEPLTYHINPDLCQEDQERIKSYQALRNYFYTYQQLKATRFGINIFGYQIGESPKVDNKIYDPKYVVGILCVRKLDAIVEAMNARKKKTEELQREHARDFVEEISKMEEILRSNSNDTAYISLRGILNKFKKIFLEHEIKDEKKSERDDYLRVLKENLKAAKQSTAACVDIIQYRLTKLVCSTSPDDFILYQNKDGMEKIVKNKSIEENPYLTFISRVIYNHEKIQKEEIEKFREVFRNGFGNFCGNNNTDVIYDSFLRIIQIKNKLVDLQDALNKLEAISDKGADIALMDVIPQTTFIVKEIMKTQQQIREEVRKFADHLQEVYQDSNIPFKNNFTGYARDRIRIDEEPCHESLLALEYLNENKEIITQEVKDKINTLVNELNVQIGFKENKLINNNHDNLTNSVIGNVDEIVSVANNELTKGENDDKLLEDWLLVSMTSHNREEFINQLSPDIKELPLYMKVYNAVMGGNKEKELEELRKNNEVLKNENLGLKRQLSDQQEIENQNQQNIAKENKPLENNKSIVNNYDEDLYEPPKVSLYNLYPDETLQDCVASIDHISYMVSKENHDFINQDNILDRITRIRDKLSNYIKVNNQVFGDGFVNKTLSDSDRQELGDNILTAEATWIKANQTLSALMKLQKNRRVNNGNEINQNLALVDAIRKVNNYIKKRAHETRGSSFWAALFGYSGNDYHERRDDWKRILERFNDEYVSKGTLKDLIEHSIKKYNKTFDYRHEYSDALKILVEALKNTDEMALNQEHIRNEIRVSFNAYTALDELSGNLHRYANNRENQPKIDSLVSARNTLFEYHKLANERKDFLTRDEIYKTEPKNMESSKFYKNII